MTRTDIALWSMLTVLTGAAVVAFSLPRPNVVVPLPAKPAAAIEAPPDRKYAMHIAFMGEDPSDLIFCYSGKPRAKCPDFAGEPGFDQASHAFISAAACNAAESAVIAASVGRFYRFICVKVP